MKNLLKKYQKMNGFEIAEVNNIEIRYEKIGQLLGYVHNGQHQAIILDENLEWYKRDFICSNLIYHAFKNNDKKLIWFKNRPDRVFSEYERQGNDFAARLHLSRADKTKSFYQQCKNHGMTDKEIKKFTSISKELNQNNTENVLNTFMLNKVEQ